MSYIRSKEIPPGSGNWYNYEVKGIRQGKKVRQKVIRYIGRVESDYSPLSGGRMPISLASTLEEPATPLEDKANVFKMKTPSRQIASAMGMYYGGMSLDAIQQQFKQDHDLDMSESNYWNWVTRFTKEAIKQTKRFKPEVGDTWVADETYMKLGKRNVYFWDIICPETNYILATHVSFTRSGRDAAQLMKLAEERAGKVPKVVVTDKLASYISGIEEAWGADTKHVQGGPFKTVSSGESTAEIERFHRTLEQRAEVFQKYKDIASIKLLTDGWLINYNFFKQNEGCGNIPPAQAASKVVPCKDWNDIVIPEGAPDNDYQVRLSRRKSVKKGSPVMDATLTPIEAPNGVVPNG
ncbi:MAG: DDE-type integrase/transposase/recombinase [Dehalococcoidales bacterium]|nr:DDE-type integrase/transposase/recombinase [Dehalococcoidales bacterium]